MKSVGLASAVSVCFAALAVAGCGGSGSHTARSSAAASASGPAAPSSVPGPASGGAHPAQATPAPSNPDVGGASARVPPARHTGLGSGQVRKRKTVSRSHASNPDRVSATHRVKRAHSSSGAGNDDESATGAKPVNPCMLVSRSEAQSITGSALVASMEAPLGPTCIYRATGSKSDITLAVESLKYTQLSKQMAQRTRVSVASHPAYCGRLGTQMLLVPLSNGRVLNVTAPCSIARRFASLALSRLEA